MLVWLTNRRAAPRPQGFQIWINLERRMKMAEPSYGTIQPEDIVEEFGDGGGISRIVGGIGSGAFEPEPRCASVSGTGLPHSRCAFSSNLFA